jgi:hypothetical protein
MLLNFIKKESVNNLHSWSCDVRLIKNSVEGSVLVIFEKAREE